MKLTDENKKKRFIQRELTWLEFNSRVLEEAKDSANPLLERVKFLGIFESNMDEFFMVRLAGLHRLLDSGVNRKDRYGYYPSEVYHSVVKVSGKLIDAKYNLLEKDMLKDLKKEKILLVRNTDLNEEQKKFVKNYFESVLYPIVTPMAVDPGHPFPVLATKTLAFAVDVIKKGESRLAIVPIPRNVPRLIKLPSSDEEIHFIRLGDIIREFMGELFKGNKVRDSFIFRVIRDSQFEVDEDETSDLLRSIESEVQKRTWGKVVFLETEKSPSQELLLNLCEGLNFSVKDVISVGASIDLSYLFELYGSSNRPDLCYQSYVPAQIPYENIFEKITEETFMTHVPYQSFYPTVDLIQQAAQDANVLAIKMTLYRTNNDSAIIQALKLAAQNGKLVTVLVEIKARFDEENNIRWVRELEAAGCHVVYGILGLKIHSKMTLVVREEEGQIKRYVHLSTGNYNEKTSRIYTDVGYFSCNDDIARDISELFNVITGYSVATSWKRVVSSPYNMRDYFYSLIDREMEYQKKNQNGHIQIKINSLEDPQMIDKLYQASQAGVKIDLIVRGICCLIPGVKGLSESITVKSIVGRYLEHTRVFYFHNGGQSRIFISSADWMRRNLDRRIEFMLEIKKDDLKKDLKNLLDWHWNDNVKARLMNSAGQYEKVDRVGDSFSVQEFLMDYYHTSGVLS